MADRVYATSGNGSVNAVLFGMSWFDLLAMNAYDILFQRSRLNKSVSLPPSFFNEDFFHHLARFKFIIDNLIQTGR